MKTHEKVNIEKKSRDRVKKPRLEVQYHKVDIYNHVPVWKYRSSKFCNKIFVEVVKIGDNGRKPNRYGQCTLTGFEAQKAYEAGCRDKDVFMSSNMLRGLNSIMYKNEVPGKFFLERIKHLIGIENGSFNDVIVISELEVKRTHQHGLLTTDLFRQMAIDFPGIWICCIEPSQFYKGWEREINDYYDVGYQNFTDDFELARPKLQGRAAALGFRPYYEGKYFIALSTDLLRF